MLEERHVRGRVWVKGNGPGSSVCVSGEGGEGVINSG